jgi:hypothetical protein
MKQDVKQCASCIVYGMYPRQGARAKGLKGPCHTRKLGQVKEACLWPRGFIT